MKDWAAISQRLVMIGQLGLSLLMPLLLCLGACYLLTSKLGLGLGLGGSFMTAYKLWLSVNRKAHEEGEAAETAFNRHS